MKVNATFISVSQSYGGCGDPEMFELYVISVFHVSLLSQDANFRVLIKMCLAVKLFQEKLNVRSFKSTQ